MKPKLSCCASQVKMGTSLVFDLQPKSESASSVNCTNLQNIHNWFLQPDKARVNITLSHLTDSGSSSRIGMLICSYQLHAAGQVYERISIVGSSWNTCSALIHIGHVANSYSKDPSGGSPSELACGVHVILSRFECVTVGGSTPRNGK